MLAFCMSGSLSLCFLDATAHFGLPQDVERIARTDSNGCTGASPLVCVAILYVSMFLELFLDVLPLE